MDAPHRALVVIDAQQDYFDGPLAIQYPPRDESLANILRILEVAEQADLPVVVVQHESPEGAPVFAVGSQGWKLPPHLEQRAAPGWKRVAKNYSSIFTAGDLTAWLHANEIDTLTLVGYMTNNCVLATAAAAEPLGFTVEVLSDATGAIHLANDAGTVPAKQLHETLMVLLHSNWAAVADTHTWASAVSSEEPLAKGDLGSSAVQGQTTY